MNYKIRSFGPCHTHNDLKRFILKRPDITILDSRNQIILIIEIDGSIHNLQYVREKSNSRDRQYTLAKIPFFSINLLDLDIMKINHFEYLDEQLKKSGSSDFEINSKDTCDGYVLPLIHFSITKPLDSPTEPFFDLVYTQHNQSGRWWVLCVTLITLIILTTVTLIILIDTGSETSSVRSKKYDFEKNFMLILAKECTA